MDRQQSDKIPPEQEEVEASEKKIAELTRANSILKANISTLYRTARAEIARKNDRITELQSELDNLLFKRLGVKSDQDNQKRIDGRSPKTGI